MSCNCFLAQPSPCPCAHEKNMGKVCTLGRWGFKVGIHFNQLRHGRVHMCYLGGTTLMAKDTRSGASGR